jgi:short-chain fatty acids transporter
VSRRKGPLVPAGGCQDPRSKRLGATAQRLEYCRRIVSIDKANITRSGGRLGARKMRFPVSRFLGTLLAHGGSSPIEECTDMNVFARSALQLTQWTSRWVPGSFTIAVCLTAVVFVAGVLGETYTGRASLPGAGLKCVAAWGDGFWVLLTFAMQMCLIILTGYIIAVSPPVKRFLFWLVARPRTPTGVILLVAFLAMSLSWINWGLGLITGAMLVKIAASSRRKVDYKLLTAAAYLGLGTTWHGGLSGSAPLLIATPGHFLEDRIGVIPVTETVFSALNLELMALVITAVLAVVWLMAPSPDEAVATAPDMADEFDEPLRPDAPTPAQRLEHSRLPNLLVGALGAVYLTRHFWTSGAVLTLDVVNLLFLTVGAMLHRSPASLIKAAEQGSRLVHGVILRFPLYAGIFGMIKATVLVEAISHAFTSVSSTLTYPLLVTYYSAVLNYFVPSGGSKWAIEAPYLLEAAQRLAVPTKTVVLAYAYGDMWTNLIQPFWAIPVLAAAKLEFKDILGYEIVVAIVYGVIISAAALLAGAMG